LFFPFKLVLPGYFHGISLATVFPLPKSSSSDIGKGDETSLSGTFAVGASHHHPDMAMSMDLTDLTIRDFDLTKMKKWKLTYPLVN